MPRYARLSVPAFNKIARFLPAAVLAAALASCAAPTPPPPPPPPPPPAKPYIPPPPKPQPPAGASDHLTVPPLDASGLRQSVNRNITPTQMVWNLRSAFNVAALNCSDPKHAEILPRYKVFLKTYAKPLTAANKKVDAEFKGRYGAKFTAPREAYMTSVYNHFALPPAMNEFCNAALVVSGDMAGVKPTELEAFALRSLPSIEVVYDDFYRRYEMYRSDLAEWNARYGPPAPAPTAGTP